MKHFTLCADDFSLSDAVNRAIIDLARQRRLDAISCLAGSPTWPGDARNLRDLPQQIGLHFNLTLPFGIPERNVSTLLAASLAKAIDHRWVARRFDEQWGEFLRHFGRPPDFIDGHQHVHVFPIIREVVIDKASQLHPTCWLRSLTSATDMPAGPFKQRLLQHIGKTFTAKLEAAGIPSNRFFAGFRPYGRGPAFRDQFRQWIAPGHTETLIMCHPGMVCTDRTDPIRDSRIEEFHYLSSEKFRSDLAEVIPPSLTDTKPALDKPITRDDGRAAPDDPAAATPVSPLPKPW